MRTGLAALLGFALMTGCDSGGAAEADGADVTDITDVTDTADGVAPETADSAEDTAGPDSADTTEDTADSAVTTIEDTADTIEDTADTTDSADTAPWRSALYPEDWVPGFADPSGALLQDYSYAGYHHGELALGAGLDGGRAGLARFSVADHAADPSGAADSTAAFQDAIDAAEAARGGIVFVPSGLYRIDDRLIVGGSRIIIAGQGPSESRLWFTRKDGLDFAAHLTFAGRETMTAEAPLTRDAAVFESEVEVADASAFAPGDDVLVGQVISDAFVAEHGMTGVWEAFNGTWQAFFRRTVAAIAPGRVTLDVPLRYPLATAHGASLRKVDGTLHEVALEHLGIADAADWEGAWQANQLNAVTFEHVADAWVLDVASFVSPGAPASGMGAGAHLLSNGLLVSGSKRVTIAESHLAKAQNRGSGGNGYLFEVRQSSEVLTRDASAQQGRHNFIQNWGFGTSGCVWLRVNAADGAQVPLGPILDTPLAAPSEYHHSLATANLVDRSRFDDGFHALNRGTESSGAGHSATECVFWGYAGRELVSLQYGRGYVIGSAPGTVVSTALTLFSAGGTAPEDWVEGAGRGAELVPGSLYEDQLARRLGRPSP